MKESGCQVSDYLLELKRATRQEKRKISKSAPRRDKIQEPKANVPFQPKKKYVLEIKKLNFSIRFFFIHYIIYLLTNYHS